MAELPKDLLSSLDRNRFYTDPSKFCLRGEEAPRTKPKRKISEAQLRSRLWKKLLDIESQSVSRFVTGGDESIGQSESPFPIDVVFTWVRIDEDFNRRRMHHYRTYNDSTDNEMNRYCDNGELRFAVRSVFTNMPWVNHIYIVVDDEQCPKWLSMDCKEKGVSLVPHSVIYGDEFANHLPTFNSHSIETHLHAIPGLSEQFIYMNDDFFVNRPMQWEHFYTEDGRPKQVFANAIGRVKKNPGMSKHRMAWCNNQTLLDQMFPQTARESRCFPAHQAVPLLKSAFEEIWRSPMLQPVLRKTSRTKFRENSNIYTIGFVIYFLKYQSRATNGTLNTFYCEIEHPDSCLPHFKALLFQKPQLFCINDGMKTKRKKGALYLTTLLQFLFPNPSPVEMDDFHLPGIMEDPAIEAPEFLADPHFGTGQGGGQQHQQQQPQWGGGGQAGAPRLPWGGGGVAGGTQGETWGSRPGQRPEQGAQRPPSQNHSWGGSAIEPSQPFGVPFAGSGRSDNFPSAKSARRQRRQERQAVQNFSSFDDMNRLGQGRRRRPQGGGGGGGGGRQGRMNGGRPAAPRPTNWGNQGGGGGRGTGWGGAGGGSTRDLGGGWATAGRAGMNGGWASQGNRGGGGGAGGFGGGGGGGGFGGGGQGGPAGFQRGSQGMLGF